MSHITLRDYANVALETGGGIIRTEKGSGDQALNRGTLGQRMASWVQDVKEFFGGKDTDRARRQEAALEGFRDALANRFGTAATNAAFLLEGLDDKGAVLTGDAVIRAIARVSMPEREQRERTEILERNADTMADYVPPRAGFLDLAETRDPRFDPRTMTDEQARSYLARFEKGVVQLQRRQGEGALSPDQVQQAARDALAQVLVASNREHVLGLMCGLHPPRLGFLDLAATLEPPFDATRMTDQQAQEYHTRLEQSVKAESRLGRLELGPDDVQRLARSALKEVAKLSESGRLEEGRQTRENLSTSFKAVLTALASEEDPKRLLDRLNELDDRLADVITAETIGEWGADDLGRLFEVGLQQAVGELAEENPGLARLAQKNAFSDSSPLRAINAEIRDPAIDVPPEKLQSFYRPATNALQLANGLGTALSPMTDAPGGDAMRFDDADTLQPSARTKAREALRSWVDTIPGKVVSQRTVGLTGFV